MRKGRPFGIVRKDLNMIHNVIFDIGNVLTDFRWKEFLMDQGYSEEMAMRIGRASTLHPCWAELDRGYWTVEQLMEAFVRNDPGIERELRSAYANVRGMVVPRAYAIPWVRELKRKGYTTCPIFRQRQRRNVRRPWSSCLIPTEGSFLIKKK